MFEAYFKALLARNHMITETMIRNQQIIAEMFSRNLDFGADFLHHQMRVFSIVTQWRDPGPHEPADPAPEAPAAEAAETEAPPPALKVVQTRR
ncbi:MAG: hypothetical protein HY060_19595 [Proteobacteria bacterium]|nr:hypothetical protein [Pseudomonadota bacterium]